MSASTIFIRVQGAEKVPQSEIRLGDIVWRYGKWQQLVTQEHKLGDIGFGCFQFRDTEDSTWYVVAKKDSDVFYCPAVPDAPLGELPTVANWEEGNSESWVRTPRWQPFNLLAPGPATTTK